MGAVRDIGAAVRPLSANEAAAALALALGRALRRGRLPMRAVEAFVRVGGGAPGLRRSTVDDARRN